MNQSCLVTSLTTLPVPSGPHAMTVPSSFKMGVTVSTAVDSPPTNRVSRPVRAPSTAPVTGESTTPTPGGCPPREIENQLRSIRGEVDPDGVGTKRFQRTVGHHHRLDVVRSG